VGRERLKEMCLYYRLENGFNDKNLTLLSLQNLLRGSYILEEIILTYSYLLSHNFSRSLISCIYFCAIIALDERWNGAKYSS